MKLLRFIWVLVCWPLVAQTAMPPDADLLLDILKKAYKEEKVIVKNRLQLLYMYSEQAPNTPELLQVLKDNPKLKPYAPMLKKAFQQPQPTSWKAALQWAAADPNNNILFQKINQEVSKEAFDQIVQKRNDFIQRMLIVNQPIHLSPNICLVRVAFYRNSEHNSSGYWWYEKVNGQWQRQEILSAWTTASEFGNKP